MQVLAINKLPDSFNSLFVCGVKTLGGVSANLYVIDDMPIGYSHLPIDCIVNGKLTIAYFLYELREE